MPEYIEVPVFVAKEIAEVYRKSQVIISSWDSEHGLLHTTTYGKEAFDKESAAAAGEICAKALGSDLSKKKEFEDFHKDYDPAFLREALELLNVVHHRQGITAPQLQQVERLLRTSGYPMRRA
jgi:hypothetical protein